MNKWLIGCLSLLAVCLVLLLTYMALMRMPNPRTKRIDLDDLMVTRADFPQGWAASGGGPITKREHQEGSQENQSASFRPESLGWMDPLGALHTVYRYRNPYQAMDAYFQEHRGLYQVRRDTSAWTVPPDWSYRSPIADQFEFACAHISNIVYSGTTCIAKARYDEFISVFSAELGSPYLTHADLERVLRAIDERMARALGKPLPPSLTPP